MESLIPIYRLAHFLGLALLFGGTVCSMVLMRKSQPNASDTKMSWNCMHLVAAPGLMLLLLTGILQSVAVDWAHFKGAGYMHAKVTLAVILLALMVFDMRTQKKILLTTPDGDLLIDMLKKRQVLAIAVCALTILIMWLVSFRPF